MIHVGACSRGCVAVKLKRDSLHCIASAVESGLSESAASPSLYSCCRAVFGVVHAAVQTQMVLAARVTEGHTMSISKCFVCVVAHMPAYLRM